MSDSSFSAITAFTSISIRRMRAKASSLIQLQAVRIPFCSSFITKLSRKTNINHDIFLVAAVSGQDDDFVVSAICSVQATWVEVIPGIDPPSFVVDVVWWPLSSSSSLWDLNSREDEEERGAEE